MNVKEQNDKMICNLALDGLEMLYQPSGLSSPVASRATSRLTGLVVGTPRHSIAENECVKGSSSLSFS